MELENGPSQGKENITDYLSGSGQNQQFGVVSKSNYLFSRKTHSRKNNDYLLGGRGKQIPIAGEIDRGVLQRLSRMKLFEKNVLSPRKKVHASIKTDRQHKDCCPRIFLCETKSLCHGRHKCVKFDMNLSVYDVPYEEVNG